MMRPIHGHRIAAIFALLVSCSEDAQQLAHRAGSEQGPCLDGDRCDPGLVCLSHTCVVFPGTGGSGGNVSASGGRGGSVAMSGGRASTGGGPVTPDASSDGGGTGGHSDSGASSSGGASGAGASTGGDRATGGTPSGGGGASGAVGSGGSSGGSSGADGGCADGGCACAATRVLLEPAPLDLYVLLDQSLSMSENVNGGKKWDLITGALSDFVQSSDSNGVSVGLGYFPLVVSNPPPPCLQDNDCGQYAPCQTQSMVCTKSDACLASNYVPDVSVGLLPGVSGAIITSLGLHTPAGFTPTYPALQASYQYLSTRASAHRADKSVLVLATDGDPTTCDAATNNVSTIANNLVAPARAGSPSIQTFVIGVGSSLTSMNQIASAGGTGQAFLVDTTVSDAGGQFLGAMTKIRSSPYLGCQYRLPAAVDHARVNVQMDPSTGSPSTLHGVRSVAACTSSGGWYYDEPSAPNQVILCDSSCAALRADPGATVHGLLGCPTI